MFLKEKGQNRLHFSRSIATQDQYSGLNIAAMRPENADFSEHLSASNPVQSVFEALCPNARTPQITYAAMASWNFTSRAPLAWRRPFRKPCLQKARWQAGR